MVVIKMEVRVWVVGEPARENANVRERYDRGRRK